MKYKTKKEKDKEKEFVMEELVIVAQTLVGGELHDEKAQSLKDSVEEAIKHAPWKFKKKMMGRDEVGSSKARAHEKTPSFIKQRKEVDEVNVDSPAKTPTTPWKQKEKEKGS